jgi:hypothetical protein
MAKPNSHSVRGPDGRKIDRSGPTEGLVFGPVTVGQAARSA